MEVDVAIVGAGPAGLCLARALEGTGLSIAVVEKAPLSAIENPAFDAREIALTQSSCSALRDLGIWQRIPPQKISAIRSARVLNGDSAFALEIRDDKSELGHFIPNCAIRRAAWEAVSQQGDVRILADTAVNNVTMNDARAELTLSDGSRLHARLAVGADSRWSETRRAVGIGAWMHDFARAMLICRMEHELEHHEEAFEWFDYGQTLALLPLRDRQCSVILMLPQSEIRVLQALDDEAYAADITRRLQGRLGAMKTVSTRHLYPLVAVYAYRFFSRRFVLMGDAAVGMSPVTAHGFNFGLDSQRRLARAIRSACDSGRDIADPQVLSRYERQHRLGTWPLFAATNAVAELYVNDHAPARALRKMALCAAGSLPLFRRAVARHLTHVAA